jgi:hypothetical protein
MGGVLTGAAIVTRTNGIALIGFLLFAITCEGIKVSKIKAVMLFIIGMMIPIVLWCSFAIYSESPIFPKYSYRNLALTYFSEGSDRISGDSMRGASEGLTSTWHVLTKDPIHIAKTYLRDLLSSTKTVFLKEGLLLFPLILLALPGLFFLIFREDRKFNRVLALNLLGMFLLLNFKAYQNRFFLYLVPFMGAGIASLLTVLYLEAKKKNQNAIILVFALFLVFSSALSIKHIKHSLDYQADLSFDSAKASNMLRNKNISEHATVIARKPHLSFYAELNWYMFPDEESMEDLKSALREIIGYQPDNSRVYLFYGFAEREFRPRLATLANSNSNVPWLCRIGYGEENGGWVLYEILPERF